VPKQPVALVIGPNKASDPGTEASLDIEYIIGTAPGVPAWFYYTEGLHQGQEPFVDWATNLSSSAVVPLVCSVSYGDNEDSIELAYALRLDLEFQKLALRGMSILYASGDDGVGCHRTGCKQQPNWPASSPFITAVGGFVGSNGDYTGDMISSGGFSNFYARPAYQAAAVAAYLAGGSLPPSSQYNSSGRAMPDVSSFSENVVVVQDGFEEPVGGTSCAAPVWGGIVALINDALLAGGKHSLGFLNQALYQVGAANAGAFIDITKGRNSQGCCTGFTARRGWDPITGWGGPNFPMLRDALLALQP